MSVIDNHKSLETLAEHLVHDDCAHSQCGRDYAAGHCYDCTLAHLKKEFAELEYLRYYYDQVYHALGPADDEINRNIAESYEGELPDKYKEEE